MVNELLINRLISLAYRLM